MSAVRSRDIASFMSLMLPICLECVVRVLVRLISELGRSGWGAGCSRRASLCRGMARPKSMLLPVSINRM